MTGLFFASLFVATFEKVHWNVAGNIGLNDITTILFLIAYVATERRPLPRTSAIVLGFFAAFALVYLAGFWNIDTQQGLTQFTKGMAKFVIHFAFLVAAIGYLAQRGERFFWRALGWFTVGFVANAVYGILQLGSQLAGHSLDNLLLNPLTGGAASINIYGAIGGQNIYRVNALTGDPNHLGVMLIVPLLMLTPVYLRMPRGHRLRWPLAIALVFLLLVDIATFSRSGGVGLIAGALVLVVPVSPLLPLEAVSLPARRRRGRAPRRALHPQALLRDLPEAASLDAGQLGQRALRGLLVHRPGLAHAPACSGSATTTSPSTTSS